MKKYKKCVGICVCDKFSLLFFFIFLLFIFNLFNLLYFSTIFLLKYIKLRNLFLNCMYLNSNKFKFSEIIFFICMFLLLFIFNSSINMTLCVAANEQNIQYQYSSNIITMDQIENMIEKNLLNEFIINCPENFEFPMVTSNYNNLYCVLGCGPHIPINNFECFYIGSGFVNGMEGDFKIIFKSRFDINGDILYAPHHHFFTSIIHDTNLMMSNFNELEFLVEKNRVNYLLYKEYYDMQKLKTDTVSLNLKLSDFFSKYGGINKERTPLYCQTYSTLSRLRFFLNIDLDEKECTRTINSEIYKDRKTTFIFENFDKVFEKVKLKFYNYIQYIIQNKK